ncbi:heavy-metal-associated domain-containing protein [Streptomyces sp. APSN-46.1]|uniref:heavy-metal-associated domain-containing protein n=1 Tax=Streptomyces sp. APSN-46.1 TaxID=2929049 RepID=UPI001FB30408|nr:heavy-metal-associated domain-containing protein [Streptomyces sp. APSN-46.1]MCJ1676229.1 heavy-metal-associated domain-containing protein [Streptomyces sp. APSN-46.1]
MDEQRYRVTGMTCGHCAGHITEEVKQVTGVSDVVVDLDAHAVTVSGAPLDDRLIRAAIVGAGYEVAAAI